MDVGIKKFGLLQRCGWVWNAQGRGRGKGKNGKGKSRRGRESCRVRGGGEKGNEEGGDK